MKEKYVFDMGGVITKHYYIQGLYSELTPAISYTDFKFFLYCSEVSQLVNKGQITLEEYFAELAAKCGIKYDYEKLLNAYLSYKGGLHRKTLFIMDFLKERGNDIYLLSNLNEADYQYLEKNMDTNIFTNQFLSYQMHKLKPETEIYEEVIDKIGTNDFYFFDDTQANIEAAQNLGIKAYQTDGNTINETMKLIKK